MKHFDVQPLGSIKVDWKALGARVKQLREENGLTVREAAKLLDMAASTISRVENGYSVDPDHFFTLLQFIGVQFDIPKELLKND